MDRPTERTVHGVADYSALDPVRLPLHRFVSAMIFTLIPYAQFPIQIVPIFGCSAWYLRIRPLRRVALQRDGQSDRVRKQEEVKSPQHPDYCTIDPRWCRRDGAEGPGRAEEDYGDDVFALPPVASDAAEPCAFDARLDLFRKRQLCRASRPTP